MILPCMLSTKNFHYLATCNKEEIMSIYDIVMLVIFFGSVIFGYRKGLAWQIASLAAIVISYFVAINFRNPVAQLISVEAPWNQFAAMLLLFLGTSLVVWTVYASTSKSIKRLELRGFDRQAGAILGVFKGGILCMLVTLFAVSLFGSTRNMVHNSATGHYVVSGIQQFSRFTPTELAGFLNPHLEQFGNNIGGIPAKRDFFPTANSQGQFQTNQTASGQGTLGGFNNQFQNQSQNQNQFQSQNTFQTGNTFQTPAQNTGQYSNAGFANNGQFQQPQQPQPFQQQRYQQQPQQQFQQPQQPQVQQNGGGSFWQSAPAQAGSTQANQNDQYQPQQTITTGSNGWPQINTTIDTKELLQRGASTTADMLRRAYEASNQAR